MFKRLDPRDINITPFKAYKEFVKQQYRKLEDVGNAEKIYREIKILVAGERFNTINVCFNYSDEERSRFHFKNGFYDFKFKCLWLFNLNF